MLITFFLLKPEHVLPFEEKHKNNLPFETEKDNCFSFRHVKICREKNLQCFQKRYIQWYIY